MPNTADFPENGLSHVVVSGGTPSEWLEMTTAEWQGRLKALSDGAAAGGAHWVTLLPHHGEDFDASEKVRFRNLLESTGKIVVAEVGHGERYVWHRDNGVNVIVECMASGHDRFAANVEAMRMRGVSPDDMSEELLSQELLQPAEQEADLVVVMGPPHRMPESMVWELAYSELVFLDSAWSDLNSSHLELALDDFNRRHRRFGGLDS